MIFLENSVVVKKQGSSDFSVFNSFCYHRANFLISDFSNKKCSTYTRTNLNSVKKITRWLNFSFRRKRVDPDSVSSMVRAWFEHGLRASVLRENCKILRFCGQPFAPPPPVVL